MNRVYDGSSSYRDVAEGDGQPVKPTRGTYTDRSGTITTGGTSQQLMAANSSRKALFVQNVSAEALWIRFGTAAAVANQPSIKLDVGAAFWLESGFVDTRAVQIIGATTGSAFTAWEA